jgi:hypothetical protein
MSQQTDFSDTGWQLPQSTGFEGSDSAQVSIDINADISLLTASHVDNIHTQPISDFISFPQHEMQNLTNHSLSDLHQAQSNGFSNHLEVHQVLPATYDLPSNLLEHPPNYSYPDTTIDSQVNHFHSPSVLHSDPSCSGGTYTTINDNGSIYKHTSDGSSYYEGHVTGRTVYNSSGDELGYAGRDGKIYDRFDHVMGSVDSCGHVYNKAGVEVYDTTKGVVGAAAYLLCVYYGGVQ